jgi:hypothetical protein
MPVPADLAAGRERKFGNHMVGAPSFTLHLYAIVSSVKLAHGAPSNEINSGARRRCESGANEDREGSG